MCVCVCVCVCVCARAHVHAQSLRSFPPLEPGIEPTSLASPFGKWILHHCITWEAKDLTNLGVGQLCEQGPRFAFSGSGQLKFSRISMYNPAKGLGLYFFPYFLCVFCFQLFMILIIKYKKNIMNLSLFSCLTYMLVP